MKLKTVILSSAALGVLSACAGGGTSEPSVPVAVPTAQPMTNVKLSDENGSISTINTNSSRSGKLQEREYQVTSYGITRTEKEFVYQAPSGKYYAISTYTDPIRFDYSNPSYELRTKHPGQPLSEGGRLFVCCSSAGATTYAPATKQDYLRFGAWIGAGGEVDLFVGGRPADSFGSSSVAPTQGKITYEVWAVRVRNGEFVTSSYRPKKDNQPTTYSLLTANFNTNKLGGTIVGNKDYGADVVMKDVNIDGINFSGSAESAGKTGKVEGKFFGKFGSSYDTEKSIGGKVTFDGDKSLDTVFGGVEKSIDHNSTSTDLTPLP